MYSCLRSLVRLSQTLTKFFFDGFRVKDFFVYRTALRLTLPFNHHGLPAAGWSRAGPGRQQCKGPDRVCRHPARERKYRDAAAVSKRPAQHCRRSASIRMWAQRRTRPAGKKFRRLRGLAAVARTRNCKSISSLRRTFRSSSTQPTCDWITTKSSSCSSIQSQSGQLDSHLPGFTAGRRMHRLPAPDK